MQKLDAIQMLGGTKQRAAEAVGISFQAVNQWPDTLTSKIEDRVHAALGRQAAALTNEVLPVALPVIWDGVERRQAPEKPLFPKIDNIPGDV